MKLFKNIFLIIALVAMNSVSARQIGGARPAGQQPAPTQQPPAPGQQVIPPLPAKGFQYYISQVRNNMTSAQVINAQGVFTPMFENLVKSSELDANLMQALLEAGRNLHMPLSGNEQDLKKIVAVQGTINNIAGISDQSGAIVPYEEGGAIVPYKEAPEFYDETSNFLDQAYLERRVKDLLQTRTGSQVISILSPELTQYMSATWKEKGVKITPARVSQVHQQIKDAVYKLEQEQKAKGQMVPYQPKTVVPYRPSKAVPTADELDDMAQKFVKTIIGYKKDNLKNALLDLQTKNSRNYAAAMINDVLKQLSQKFPSVTQDQAIRMFVVAMDVPITAEVLSFIMGTVRNYGKVAPTTKPTALAIEYTSQDIGKELNPKNDPMLQRIIKEAMEKERERGLAIVPYQPAPQPQQQPAVQPKVVSFNQIERKSQENFPNFVSRLIAANEDNIKSILFEKDVKTFNPQNTADAEKFVVDLALNINKEFTNIEQNRIIEILNGGISLFLGLDRTQGDNLGTFIGQTLRKQQPTQQPAPQQQVLAPLRTASIRTLTKFTSIMTGTVEDADSFAKRLVNANQAVLRNNLFNEYMAAFFKFEPRNEETAKNLISLLDDNIAKEYTQLVRADRSATLLGGFMRSDLVLAGYDTTGLANFIEKVILAKSK